MGFFGRVLAHPRAGGELAIVSVSVSVVILRVVKVAGFCHRTSDSRRLRLSLKMNTSWGETSLCWCRRRDCCLCEVEIDEMA
jgi:hypothetical protein